MLWGSDRTCAVDQRFCGASEEPRAPACVRQLSVSRQTGSRKQRLGDRAVTGLELRLGKRPLPLCGDVRRTPRRELSAVTCLTHQRHVTLAKQQNARLTVESPTWIGYVRTEFTCFAQNWLGIHATVDRDVDGRNASLLVDVTGRRRVGVGVAKSASRRRPSRSSSPALTFSVWAVRHTGRA